MNTTMLNPHDRLLAPLATVPACQHPDSEAYWFPPVDIIEALQEYVFKIDLPEVPPENVQIVVEGDGLFISGVRPKPFAQDQTFLRIERPHGYFERRFALPDDASRVEIESVLNGSVLELHVHKVVLVPAPPAPTNAPPRLRIRRTS
jgi:HSP20 family protein